MFCLIILVVGSIFSGSDAYGLVNFLVLIYQTSQQVNLQMKINRKQRKGSIVKRTIIKTIIIKIDFLIQDDNYKLNPSNKRAGGTKVNLKG
jgi:hypothetical protein